MTTPANQPEALVAFLRAQLDDDERIARAVNADPMSDCWFDCTGEGHGDHHLRWDPYRVLAEVDAKRRIVRDIAIVVISPGREVCPPEWVAQLESFLRVLAIPYADRKGYREEWRP